MIRTIGDSPLRRPLFQMFGLSRRRPEGSLVKSTNEQLVYSLGPTVFRNGSVQKDGGLRCSEGWLSIIIDLVIKLEIRARKSPPSHQLEITCIKEKFGLLRVYTDRATFPDLEDIKVAEKQSETTCEVCGSPGKMYSGWSMRTLCDPCIVQQKEAEAHAARN